MTGEAGANSADEYRAYERAIERLAIGFGLVGSLAILFTSGWRTAVSFAVGSSVSWVNFRWLKAGVSAMAARFAGSNSNERIPTRVFVKFVGRFALLLGVVYVILSRSLLPATPLFAGLFTTVAAALVQMILLLAPGLRPTKRS